MELCFEICLDLKKKKNGYKKIHRKIFSAKYFLKIFQLINEIE